MYAAPVLLPGLGSLILSKMETELIEKHYKNSLRQLLRLNKNTPRCVVYFLAGSLPGTALLHLRQFSLFGMICRKSESLLNQHAKNIFTLKTLSKASWFFQIRNLCLQYSLPHPYDLLQNPPLKHAYKRLVKSKVVDYWEILLRQEADNLRSLVYFKPRFMSLCQTHPLWTTAKYSPSKVSMAQIQANMLSGRYPCGALLKHWSKGDGCCKLSPSCTATLEDLPHILSECPALESARYRLGHYTQQISELLPPIATAVLLDYCRPSHPSFCNFLLDCSVVPPVIRLVQDLGFDLLCTFFTVTRTWLFVLHRERLKLLGSWKLKAY